jgi:hypothetical protein
VSFFILTKKLWMESHLPTVRKTLGKRPKTKSQKHGKGVAKIILHRNSCLKKVTSDSTRLVSVSTIWQ